MIRWFFLFLLLIFIYHVREVFPPFIVGGIIAYLLNPFVKYLCKSFNWLRPGIAIAFIYLGFVLILSLTAWHFGPTLVDQFSNLVENRHEMVESLVEQVSTQFGMSLDIKKTAADILGSLEGSVGKPEEIVHMGGLISKSLLAILVTIVSSVYFMLDSARVGHFFLRFVPQERRVTVVNLSSQMNVMLSKYVSGQLLLIIIMSIIAFTFLSYFKLKYALLIAIVSGVLEIIPVLGPLLAISIATIMAIAQLGFSVAWIIPLCYWIARLFEDYYIVPNIVGHAVELHPLAVIFAVLVGETMAGALGMLIAIPVAASVKVILDFLYPDAEAAPHHKHEHGNPFGWLINLMKSGSKNSHSADLHRSITDDCAHLNQAQSLAHDLEKEELREKALKKLDEKKKSASSDNGDAPKPDERSVDKSADNHH